MKKLFFILISLFGCDEKYKIKKIPSKSAVFIHILFLFSCISAKEEHLFNGNSFSGWEESTTRFSIRENSIVGGSLEKAYEKSSYLCTESIYDDFELNLLEK